MSQGAVQIGPQRYRESFGRHYEDVVVGDVYEHRPGRTLTGQPTSHQGHSLVPVARLTGWQWGAPGQGGVGAFVRLTPAEVRVTAADGTELTVALTNTDGQAVRGMLGAAGMVAPSIFVGQPA